LSDLTEKLIPFFDTYPILGIKALDYADFKLAVNLIEKKAHLTKDGLEKIKKIQSGMNRGRTMP
jgi:hypothetical protein